MKTKAYVKPMLMNYGKSETLIKGDCGWGGESWRLNKTGATNVRRNRIVRMACNPNTNPGQTMCDYCNSVTVCSTTSSNC